MQRKWTSEENRRLRMETDAAVERQEAQRRAEMSRDFIDPEPRIESQHDRDKNAREAGYR